MNINKISHTNFKGFENVLSHTIDEGSGNTFSFMAMKLNNEDKNDLEIWQTIQKELFNIKTPSEYFIFHSLNRGKQVIFSVDDRLLDLNQAKNRKDEGLMLRTFDLIASITKRIIYSAHLPENKFIYLTLAELKNNLENIMEDKFLAGKLATEAAMKRIKHYKTAELMNPQTTRYVENYFKRL